MNDEAKPIQKLLITQHESKRVVAVVAHLRQLFRAALLDGAVQRPIFWDHPEVLLTAASLRTLLFDDSPSPILLDFLKNHVVTIQVETLETTCSMLLLSEIEPGSGPHVSDLLASILLDPKVQEDFKLNEPHSFMTVLQEGFGMVDNLSTRQNVWCPGPAYMERTNSTVGYQPNLGLCQYAQITRKIVDLSAWGNVCVGFLKEKPIRRRNIISYVANKLGGVHYDSRRLPSKEADVEEFRLLATAYDWDAQSVTHAGLVSVALACIELVRTPAISSLLYALEDFHLSRQERLRNGIPVGAAPP